MEVDVNIIFGVGTRTPECRNKKDKKAEKSKNQHGLFLG